VTIVENRARNRLGYQLASGERREIDTFVQRHESLLVLTRYNDTAAALLSFFNRRIPLWEGYTRYALDELAEAMKAAGDDCGGLGHAIVMFMGRIGVGFSPSAFGDAFEREVQERCARHRRGKPAKLQELARLLLTQPDHQGVSQVLRRIGVLVGTDADFSGARVDCRREFWDAVHLGDSATIDEGVAAITHRRNYTRPKPPSKAVSTVHKAKGIECEAVVLMPCDRTTFPDNLASRYLLYVALSRAKSGLVIVASSDNRSPLVLV
jgi:DNA helicase-2/ATP-dependent DNA helicase PcrA